MFKSTKAISFALFALIVAAGMVFAQADQIRVKHVSVEGVSFIEGGNTSLARNLAMEDAKRKAVEAGAGVYVKTQSEIDAMGNLNEQFLSRSQGFLGNLKIISEGVRGQEYHINIEADVFLDIILENLSDLDILDDHKVMLFIDEKTSGTPFSAATLETELMAQLIKNFIIVDRQQMDAVAAKGAVDQALKGDLGAAVALANQFGADTFIVGSAQAQLNTDMSREYNLPGFMGTYDAVVQLKVVNANTARVIFAKNYQVTGKPANSETMSANNAMVMAGQVIGKDVNVEVPKFWGAASVDGYRYRVTVNNASFSTLAAITALLQSTDGFVKITGEQFNGGVLTFDLMHKFKAINVAGLIDGKTSSGQTFRVKGFTDSSLDLSVS
ncbi:MAG: flagellar assembly protein T N-terminal domain-containing protein [bacterium]|jgi:hypothetical protein